MTDDAKNTDYLVDDRFAWASDEVEFDDVPDPEPPPFPEVD